MEFIFKDKAISLNSEKKNISFHHENVNLDGLLIDSAGEYEKSGFLMYAREKDGIRYFSFRVEGFWIGYISEVPTEIPAEIIDFFGQLDVLVAPFGKNEQRFVEQIEPKILVSFAETAMDLSPIFGPEIASGNSYKLKSADISQEKTSLVILSE